MNITLKLLLPKIEAVLSSKEITSFIIGKTDNAHIRFNQEDYNGYEYASVIARSDDPDLISDAENDLIKYFQSHTALNHKCKNDNAGSGGNPNAKSLYIVAMGPEPRIGHEALLDKCELFGADVFCEI